MGIMYINTTPYNMDESSLPTLHNTTVIASIHMLCTCLSACVHVCVCVSEYMCVYLCLIVLVSGAHTQIENMFGSPFGMFSLSFPHLMLLICMQQVCRWRHLDANTHTHTHTHPGTYTDRAHSDTHMQTHTDAGRQAGRRTHTHTLTWRVSCFNTHLAKF